MTWWWDSLHPANDYWLFSSLGKILNRTGWGRGSWSAIAFGDGQPLTAVGMRGLKESLVYVVAPSAAWPTGATNATLPLQHGQSVTLTNWSAGMYYAQWYDPTTGALVGVSQGTTTNRGLTLPLPDYSVDLAGIVYPPPTLLSTTIDQNEKFQFQLNSENGGILPYAVEKSVDLLNWTNFLTVTNTQGMLPIMDPAAISSPATFYRVKQN